MRVLFLTTHFNAGGITRYVLTLARQWIHEGDEVHLISAGGNRLIDLQNLGGRHQQLDIRTKSELSPRIYRALGVVKTYARRHAIQVVHAQTRVTQVMAALLSRKTGIPYVTTCHGFFTPRLSRRIFPCWGQRTIAISHAVAEHLQNDFALPADRVRVIHSGINLNIFHPIAPHERTRRRERLAVKGAPLVGMVARLSEVKGQDILLRALPALIRQWPLTRLLLIGEGRSKASLEALARELGVRDRVTFFPVMEKAEEMISLLDVFVNPSRHEGLGLAVMEAQACGVPVVATRVGGIPELIDHGRTGLLVPPESPADLAAAIGRLWKETSLRQDVIRAALERARTRYAASIMSQKTKEVYREVVPRD